MATYVPCSPAEADAAEAVLAGWCVELGCEDEKDSKDGKDARDTKDFRPPSSDRRSPSSDLRGPMVHRGCPLDN